MDHKKMMEELELMKKNAKSKVQINNKEIVVTPVNVL